jgi:hypothetical protein
MKGRLIGVETRAGDMIATWKQEGKMKPETLMDEILIPACFSLGCTDCDRDGPDTREQAIAEGWTGIGFDPELASLNYVGKCPQCAKEQP